MPAGSSAKKDSAKKRAREKKLADSFALHLKPKQIIALVLLFLGIAGGTTALLGFANWSSENSRTDEQVKNAVEAAKIRETNGGAIVEQDEDPDEDNPYWAFIKMNLLNVDLKNLMLTNDETKGWVQVAGTNVNYPFVQHDDNEYYLKHSFDKSTNSAGWVFMDYRNNANMSDKNTIFYAHGRVDTTMFGGLRHILYNGWLSDRANFVVRTSSPEKNGIWQIFSVYHLPTTTDYLKTNFKDDNEYAEFLKMITERSAYDFRSAPNSKDQIVTLSTCYNDRERMVVHAKLVKFN